MVEDDWSSSSSGSSGSSEDDFMLNPSSANLNIEEREAALRRKMLESFYGMNVSDGAETEQGADKDEESCVLDVDSANFVPENAVIHLLQNQDTEALLQKHEQLTSEIRCLDSSLQTLVYENYQKFIHATDAVKQIGSSMSTANESLQTLSQSVEKAEECATRLEESLSPIRKKIADQLSVEKHLKSLQSILNLKVTLTKLKNELKFREACKCAQQQVEILNHPDFVKFESLKRIRLDCNIVMKEIAAESFKLLRKWSMGALSREEYPQNVTEIFECISSLQTIFARNGRAIPSYANDNVKGFIVFEVLQVDDLPDLEDLSLRACSEFLEHILLMNEENASVQMLENLIMTVQLYPEIVDADHVHCDSKLVDFVEKSLDTFISYQHTSKRANSKESVSLEKLAEVCGLFTNRLRNALIVSTGPSSKRVDEIISKFADESNELLELDVQRKVSTRFLSLKEAVIHKLWDLLAEYDTKINDSDTENILDKLWNSARLTLSAIMKLTEKAIASLYDDLESCMIDQDVVLSLVTESSKNFILWLIFVMETVAGCENSVLDKRVLRLITLDESSYDDADGLDESMGRTSTHSHEILQKFSIHSSTDLVRVYQRGTYLVAKLPKLALVLAKMCVNLGKMIIPVVDEAMTLLADRMGLSYRYSGSKNLQDDEDIMHFIKDIKSNIFLCYLCSCNCRLRKSVSELLSVTSVGCNVKSNRDIPTKPSGLSKELLSIAMEAAGEYSILFDDEIEFGELPSSHDLEMYVAHHQRRAHVSNKSEDMMFNVERMLMIRPEIYSKIEASRSSIISTILMMGLKTMSELVRESSLIFNTTAQIEFDLLFLRMMFPYYVVDTKFYPTLEQLLEDTALVVEERSQVILEENQVRKIHFNLGDYLDNHEII